MLRSRVHLYDIQELISCLTENILCLYYTAQVVKLSGKIITTYCENHRKYTNALYGQNTQFL
jgi:hypothetical protein